MEERINIAEILKNKPKGTSLWSMVLGKCTLEKVIIGRNYPIRVKSTNTRDFNSYSCEGIYDIGFEDSECILFPSKKMRDWNKFAWKKGDVLVNKDRDTHVIFEEFTDDTYTTFTGKHYRSKISKNGYEYVRECSCATEEFTLETEDAAQTYIKTIEEKLGDKLNRETLEIEKQNEFKDGDIVVCKCKTDDVPSTIFIFRGKDQLAPYYSYYASLEADGYLSYRLGEFGIYNRELRLATEEEKLHLFEALANKGKAWDAERKAIVDLKPKVELKPFDKVLVRDSIINDTWRINFFESMASDFRNDLYYRCMTGTWRFCIPYNENTKRLLGTTDEWEGGKE